MFHSYVEDGILNLHSNYKALYETTSTVDCLVCVCVCVCVCV